MSVCNNVPRVGVPGPLGEMITICLLHEGGISLLGKGVSHINPKPEAIQASDSISIQINYEAYADILQNTSTEMNSAKTQSEIKSSSSPAPPAPTSGSCRKKKSEGASFIADVRDHIDEFINASMDEHKTCFKKSMQKMFGMSKIVAERSSEMKEVESSLPLKTTVSEQ